MGIAKRTILVGDIVFDNAEINTITPDTGTHFQINGVTGKDLKFKLTDADGARKVIVLDSADAEVATIDSNGVITAVGGLVGALTGNVTGNIAQSGADLTITTASAKDAIIKLGDALGAKKLLIKDSANAEQASIDSDGTITAKKVVAPISYAHSDTSGAPTNAECISAFGAVASVGAGFVGIYKDDHESGKMYVCACDGTKYAVAEMTDGA